MLSAFAAIEVKGKVMSVSTGSLFKTKFAIGFAIIVSIAMLSSFGAQAQDAILTTLTSSDVCITERTSNVTFKHARWQFGEFRNNSTTDKIPVSCPVSIVYLADHYNFGYMVHNLAEETQTVTCTLTEWSPLGKKDQVLNRSIELEGGYGGPIIFEDVTMVDPVNILHVRCVLPPETALKHQFVDNIL